MVAVDKGKEDFSFVLKEGSGFVASLLPLYQKMITGMHEEDRNEFFQAPTPINNWQLSVILTYASLLEKMLVDQEMNKGD